jgi:hypothetical protein
VRQVAQAHGGEVKLVSALDRGSAFAIWIPAAVPAHRPGSDAGDDVTGQPATSPPSGEFPALMTETSRTAGEGGAGAILVEPSGS